jgi:hypothetical protein
MVSTILTRAMNKHVFSTTAFGNEDPIASWGNLVLHPGICQFIRYPDPSAA